MSATSDPDAAAMAEARRIMVDRHVRPADVTNRALIDAMLQTPREAHFSKARRAQAYLGDHAPLGGGRYELDARIQAKMIEALEPKETELALVIGSGGGYAAAVLSQLVAAVIALEPEEALSAVAAAAFDRDNRDTVVAEIGPLADGCAKHAPYNVILVNGAIEIDPPAPWIEQLVDGGRMALLRRAGASGRCDLLVKSGETASARPIFDATAPLLPGFERPAGFEF